jgi:hypothetical protein
MLSEENKQQVIALGKLGWTLRRIEQPTEVRRETAGAYLKAAGIAVRPPGAWGRRAGAKPANEVTPTLACKFRLRRTTRLGLSAVSRIANGSNKGSVGDAMPKPFGRTWFPITVFSVATGR